MSQNPLSDSHRSPARIALAVVLGLPCSINTYTVVNVLLIALDLPPSRGFFDITILVTPIREIAAAFAAAALPVYLMRQFLSVPNFELAFYLFIVLMCCLAVGSLVFSAMAGIPLEEKSVMSYVFDALEVVAFIVGAWVTRQSSQPPISSDSRQLGASSPE